MCQSSELLEHLVTVVTLLEQMETIPTQPPIKLSKRHNDITLGTKLAGLIDLDNILLKNAKTLRINAMKERDHLESNGFGDQFNEMQAMS